MQWSPICSVDMIRTQYPTYDSLLIPTTIILQQQIYTWVGNVLIAVNPWKILKDPPYVRYIACSPLPLFLYSHQVNIMVEKAYRNMLRDKSPQSMVVSGESGAGVSIIDWLLLLFIHLTENRNLQIGIQVESSC